MRRGVRLARGLAAAAASLCPFVATASAVTRPGQASRNGYAFAPYVDVTGYPAPNLVTLGRAAGVRQISLGFITASGGHRCAPRWGGEPTLAAAGAGAYRRRNIEAFAHQGGQTVISFGGAAGVELATACHTSGATRVAYGSAIAAYRPVRVDFDIEGATIGDRRATARRDAAIAALQRAHPALRVSFTLPVLPSGITADGLAVLRDAIAHHVRLTFVNVMTMDYGDDAAPHPAGRMAAYGIAAARATLRQLQRLYPHDGAAALRRRIGLTPMIGVNDVSTERFGLSDAHQLADYARANGLGLLAMWSLGRDRACAHPAGTAQENCSGVAQPPYAFARAIQP